MSLFRSIRRPLAIAVAMITTGASVQAQTVLTVSSWLPPGHVLSETQKAWCAELEQKAAGKVRCNILPRAVTAPPGTFDAVRNGLADLSYTVQGYTPGRFVTTQMARCPSSATRRKRCRWLSSAPTASTRRSPPSTRAPRLRRKGK